VTIHNDIHLASECFVAGNFWARNVLCQSCSEQIWRLMFLIAAARLRTWSEKIVKKKSAAHNSDMYIESINQSVIFICHRADKHNVVL